MGEDDVRKTWKKYFEDMHDVDTEKLVTVNMCGFDVAWKGNFFGGQPGSNTEV